MGQRTRAQRLNGLFPLSYTGVVPVSPVNFVIDDRPPTVNDSKNFYIGDIWLNSNPTPPGAGDVWMLTSLDGNNATWVNFGGTVGSLTFAADVGTATPAGGIINIFSADPHLSTSAAGNTVSIDIGPALAAQYTTDSGIAIPALSNLNVVGGLNVITSAPVPGGDTIEIDLRNDVSIGGNLTVGGTFEISSLGQGVMVTDAGGLVSSIDGTDGQVIIGSTAGSPAWASLTAGAGITITPGSNSITIAAVGGGSGIFTLTGDAGGAVGPDGGGNVNILGSALVIVTGTPASNELEITLTGSVPTQFVGNVGVAVPSVGVLNIVGTGALSTTAAGNTVTIGFAGGSPLQTLTGNTGGAISPTAGNINVVGTNVITTSGAGSTLTASLTNGTNGQVLIGGGAQPLWANLTSSGGTVTITNGPNTINLEASGGGGVAGTASFFAYLPADVVIGNQNSVAGFTYYLGTGQVLTVQFDAAGAFYPGDGISNPATFTAPATGRYFISWTGNTEHVVFGGNTITGYPMLGFLTTSGFNISYGNQQSNNTSSEPDPAAYSGTLAAVLDMTAGDTVQFTYVTSYDNGSLTNSSVRFKSIRSRAAGPDTYYATFVSGYRIA